MTVDKRKPDSYILTKQGNPDAEGHFKALLEIVTPQKT